MEPTLVSGKFYGEPSRVWIESYDYLDRSTKKSPTYSNVQQQQEQILLKIKF